MTTPISAQAVKELRTATQAGVMECKIALTQAKGDRSEAIRILKEKGMLLAEKKVASRTANEGIIVVAQTPTAIFLIPFFCETDFVAKNNDFTSFTHHISQKIAENGKDFIKSTACQEQLTELIGKLREKIVIGEPIVHSPSPTTLHAHYLHTNKKIAALIVAALPAHAPNIEQNTLNTALHNVAMQTAAMNPLALSVAAISPQQLDAERQIFLKQMEAQPKSDEIKAKIVSGKLKKYFAERCLLEMPFVKDPKLSVKAYLTHQAKACGLDFITPVQMHRLAIGEN